MSDAIGGVVNMMLILFFVVFLALYMSFSINYQKAFNVKNKIISIYQESNGICDDNCTSQIESYEEELGYGKMTMKIRGDERCPTGYGYCVIGVQANQTQGDNNILTNKATKKCYFKIRTQVEIAIPIVNNLMGLKIFDVTGQTSAMTIVNSQSCQKIAEQVKNKNAT